MRLCACLDFMSELSHEGSGFPRIASVEVQNEFLCMIKLCGWYPRSFFVSSFVTCPSYIVQKFAMSMVVNFRVKNFGDFIFEFSLNFNQWWGCWIWLGISFRIASLSYDTWKMG